MRFNLQHPVTAIAGTLRKGPGPSFASRNGRQMSQRTPRGSPMTSSLPTAWRTIFQRINQRRAHLTIPEIAGWKRFANQIPQHRLGTTYRIPWWSAFLLVNAHTLVRTDSIQDNAPLVRPTIVIDSLLGLSYNHSLRRITIGFIHTGQYPTMHLVKAALWQGSLSTQRHALPSELRWICGPTPSSIIPVKTVVPWYLYDDPVFTFSETVWQTLELTIISHDGWPARPQVFHEQQVFSP